MQSSKVHLLSTDHYSGVSNTWQMPFDPSLKQVTVALSGPAPDIEIKNPEGKIIVVWNPNMYIFLIEAFISIHALNKHNKHR